MQHIHGPKERHSSIYHKGSIESSRLPINQQLQPIRMLQFLFCMKNQKSGHQFFSQAKAQQQKERPVDSGQNLQNKLWYTFTSNERYQLQSNKTNYIHLNAGIRLKIFVHSTNQHGTIWQSEWKLVRREAGLNLSTEPSMIVGY